VWGAGHLVVLLLRMCAVLFLSVGAAIMVAPAARVGQSWARNFLQLPFYVWLFTAAVTVRSARALLLCVLLLGQAQLVSRGAAAPTRLRPARWCPATDGEHGRDYFAPVAARKLPYAQYLRLEQ
jgi:hypothetical protein